jgi:hypothetical protein
MVVFGGAYFLNSSIDIGEITTWAGLVLVLLSLAGLVGFAVNGIRERKFELEHALIISALVSVGITLVLKEGAFSYRYLIPFTLTCMLTLCVGVGRKWKNEGLPTSIIATIVVAVALTGGGVMVQIRDVTFDGYRTAYKPDRESMSMLVMLLAEENIRSAYVTDPMLQWNIMFETQKQTLCRWYGSNDRDPRILQEIRERKGGGTAIIGKHHSYERVKTLLGPANEGRLLAVNDRFFVILNPAEELIRKIGFSE